MQIKANKKNILVCLIICTLFLTSYVSVFNAGRTILPELKVFTGSSLSGGNESAMSGEASTGHLGYLANFENLISRFSIKQARELNTKTGFNTMAAAIATLVFYLVYSSSLLQKTCTPFNSIQITIFLHKKDGMK
jgi:hypothetical protein